MDSAPIGKRRNLGFVILFCFFTLGIYSLYWYYKINSEIKKHDPSQDISPILAVLAIFIPIVNLVSLYNTANRIKMMQKVDGTNDLISPGVALLWLFVPFLGYPVYIQSALNNHWHEHRNDAIAFDNKSLMEPQANVVQAEQPVKVHDVQRTDYPSPESTSRITATTAYNLYGLSGPLAGACVDLSAYPIVMGRDPRISNLIIPSGSISRKHCTLIFMNGNIILEDNDSVNGTYFIDGQRLASGVPYKLNAGDRFFLADRAILFEIRSG